MVVTGSPAGPDVIYAGEGSIGQGYPVDPDPAVVGYRRLFDEVGQITVPWLLIHGTADDVVLIHDSRDAYDTAEEPKRLVEIKGAGHSFDEKSYPQVINEVAGWLDEHLV